MKSFVFAALAATSLLAAPALGAGLSSTEHLNPFAGQDNGVVIMPDGTVFPAALPAVTASNEQAVFGQLDITVNVVPDGPAKLLDGRTYAVARHIVVNQCLGADTALAYAEWFEYRGEPALVTFCGHQIGDH